MYHFNRISPVFWVVLSLVLWLLMNYLVSRLTGWGRIAVHYRSDGRIPGRIWRFQTITTRWGMGYKGSTNVGADSRGLYIFFGFFFRFGHPPIFVPWNDITITEKQVIKSKMLELRFRNTRDLPVRIDARLGASLAEAAGPNWPGGSFD